MLGSRGRCWAQEAYEQGMVKSGSAVFMIGAAAFGLPLLLRTLGERKTIFFVMSFGVLGLCLEAVPGLPTTALQSLSIDNRTVRSTHQPCP